MSLVNRQPTVVREEVQTNTTQVLVAKTEIGLGQITGAENFRWQDWPQNSINAQYVQRSARPNAINDFVGAVARSPMLPGEPVTALKLVRAGDGGVLAAILPAGMRAISTRIKEETAAGRLILPNDRVDVTILEGSVKVVFVHSHVCVPPLRGRCSCLRTKYNCRHIVVVAQSSRRLGPTSLFAPGDIFSLNPARIGRLFEEFALSSLFASTYADAVHSHEDSAAMISFAPHTSAARLLVMSLVAGAAMLAMAAFCPGKARAAEDLIVNYDQSQLLKLPRPAAEIIIGNPSIADVSVQNGTLLVVTGKTFGITNMIILDAQRNVILEQRILVKRDETKVVNLNRGTLRQSYNRCPPIW